jgi:N-carbamoyl-D-amino-acid hydrolase
MSTRTIKVAAAQMGPNNETASRDEIIGRMLSLMELAIRESVDILVYPELALTTYFPKRVRNDYGQFFEEEMPNASVAPLFKKAEDAGISFHMGYAEKEKNNRYNTTVFVENGKVIHKYRKLHLPGLGKPDPNYVAKVFELHYFHHGNTGLKSFDSKYGRIGMFICQDRRYPESYRVLGLQGAEIILHGYNTTVEPLALSLNELVLRAGAYQNTVFVVGAAKAGVEDGVELIGGSSIIDPQGQVIACASTQCDELVTARLDLGQIESMRRRWNFYGRRHPEQYALLTEPVKTVETKSEV